MSSRPDSSYLKDILTAAGKVTAIASRFTEAGFFADEVAQAAVLHHLSVIGEAIARLSPEIKKKYPEVPWHQVVAVRHRIVHAYFDLDWQILWVAATDDVPAVAAQVDRILESEFPD